MTSHKTTYLPKIISVIRQLNFNEEKSKTENSVLSCMHLSISTYDMVLIELASMFIAGFCVSEGGCLESNGKVVRRAVVSESVILEPQIGQLLICFANHACCCHEPNDQHAIKTNQKTIYT